MARAGELTPLRRGRFARCVAGSVAAHAVAAAVAAATAQPRVAVAPTQPTTVLAMRVIADPAPAAHPTASGPLAFDVTAGSATALEPTVVTPPDASVAALPPTPPATNATDDYLPRELLTQPPVASGLIVVPYPAELPSGSRHSLTLMLYVDEAGVVRRVRTEGSAPAQAMVIAAHQTFLRARFAPGQIDGRAVKSLMEVEVTFDSTPLGDAP